ncbi:hypothetical protein EQG66_11200 [Sphingobium fluviale]|uniref:Phytoene synthase n=2 Tax=Sphingobium fluviale TaxID=2506423 RepID=A0A4Q1KFS5_9SPHN|nr:hypothetical protein EQG66_11200 [Sphingobium fluviale]
MDEMSEISPFQRLVCTAAGRKAGRAAGIFALDNACAQIARTVTEPIMAQIRLAWWRDGLMAEALSAQHVAPDMLALRSIDEFAQARLGLVAIIDGWEELIAGGDGNDRDMLLAYAAGRGAGLLAALVPEYAERSARAGQVWALWDLAGHVTDAALREAAIGLACQIAESANIAGLPRIITMLVGPALSDVRRGRGAPPVLTPGLYARMMRFHIFGR